MAGRAQPPIAVSMVGISTIADRIVRRHGPRAIVTCGLATIATAVGHLAAVADPHTGDWLLVPGLAAAGAGLALVGLPHRDLPRGR